MIQSAAAGPQVETVEQAQLLLRGLERDVERGTLWVRRLKWLAALLVALLVLLMITLHLYRVFQYARVSKVTASAVAGRPESAEIRYIPESSGKIEFVREGEGLHQTLTEYAGPSASGPPTPKDFTWSGKQGEHPTFRVTYRSTFFLTTEELPIAK